MKQVWESELLSNWQEMLIEIDEFEKRTLLNLQKPLIKAGKAWNEIELENKFISPLIMATNIDDDNVAYFLERFLSGVVGDY